MILMIWLRDDITISRLDYFFVYSYNVKSRAIITFVRDIITRRTETVQQRCSRRRRGRFSDQAHNRGRKLHTLETQSRTDGQRGEANILNRKRGHEVLMVATEDHTTSAFSTPARTIVHNSSTHAQRPRRQKQASAHELRILGARRAIESTNCCQEHPARTWNLQALCPSLHASASPVGCYVEGEACFECFDALRCSGFRCFRRDKPWRERG